MDYDEVDAFDANREKILLEAAGEYGRRRDSVSDGEDEVMGFNEENDDEEIDEDEDENQDEDEDDKGWGGRKNYYGGDDASDDEDAKQIAEEAHKQQKKHLQALAMDDYIDDEMMEDWKKASEPVQTVSVETAPTSLHKLDDRERLALLKQNYPEFVPLLAELQTLMPRLEELKKEDTVVARVQRVALAAYLGSVASYFSLFTSNLKSGDAFTMKDSPVMESILTAREVWRQAKSVGKEREDENVEENVDDVDENVDENVDEVVDEEEVNMDEDEEGEEDEDEEDDEEDDNEAEEDEDDESEEDDADNNSLPIDISKPRTIRKTTAKPQSDFAESAIDEVDAEEKARRRKSLRFYTAKIDKAAKKNSVRNDFGGDLDLPYQERLFERQQRLIEEARKRGLSKEGADLDSDEPEDRDDHGDHDDFDDHLHLNDDYESLKHTKAEKKVARKKAHEDAVKAAKEGRLAELQESVGEDGKRALNFQILKNKGLTPHRKKENRNSRVKKRKQYEKAQKKLKSVRQVYQEHTGPYEGEKTGIKKGTTRSVKLV